MPVSSVQFAQVPWGYATGLKITNDATTPNTKLNIAAGSILDSTGVYQLTNSASVTIDTGTTGLNGLDTGVLLASRLYYLYIVADPVTQQTTGAIASLSATPLLPFGYSAYALVGYAFTDGSVHFLKGYWTAGKTNYRKFAYDAPIATAVTAGNSASFAAVALTNFVPPVEDLPVSIAYAYTPNAASDIFAMTPGNGTGNAVAIRGQVAAVVNSGNATVFSKVTSAVPEIDYKVSAGTVAINVAGFDFTI